MAITFGSGRFRTEAHIPQYAVEYHSEKQCLDKAAEINKLDTKRQFAVCIPKLTMAKQ